MLGDFGLTYVFWFYLTWLPTYLEKAQHFSIGNTGLVAALPYVAGAVAVLGGGRISDLMIKRRAIEPYHARRLTITLAAVLTGAMLLVTSVSHGAALTVVLLTAGMLSYGIGAGPVWALAADVTLTRRHTASIGSIQNFAGFVGGAIAPILTGWIVQHYGGFGLVACRCLVLVCVAGRLVSGRLSFPSARQDCGHGIAEEASGHVDRGGS
jgi:MFS family permease